MRDVSPAPKRKRTNPDRGNQKLTPGIPSTPVKIVLDTTILVRANEHSHGLARELLTTIIENRHTLLLSNEMLHELAKVLRYPRLQAFYDLTENLVFDYCADLLKS